jgi:Protein of unknown function (DUF3096)
LPAPFPGEQGLASSTEQTTLDRQGTDSPRFRSPMALIARGKVLMIVTTEHISPMIALIAGFLILVLPSLLNYVIALYLIITGLVGLNAIYHFVG